jgi:DNA-binding NarL/FixJ family response regulator
MDSARLLLVESHGPLAAFLLETLSQEPGFSLLDGVYSVRQALTVLIHTPVDAVIIDLTLNDMCGLEAIPLILQNSPLVKVILLVDHTDHRYIEAAVQKGAYGCVCKHLIATDLIPAVQRALAPSG